MSFLPVLIGTGNLFFPLSFTAELKSLMESATPIGSTGTVLQQVQNADQLVMKATDSKVWFGAQPTLSTPILKQKQKGRRKKIIEPSDSFGLSCAAPYASTAPSTSRNTSPQTSTPKDAALLPAVLPPAASASPHLYSSTSTCAVTSAMLPPTPASLGAHKSPSPSASSVSTPAGRGDAPRPLREHLRVHSLLCHSAEDAQRSTDVDILAVLVYMLYCSCPAAHDVHLPLFVH